MNISNETKVGALTSVAIVLLILGFNFLKGKNLTVTTSRYYAVFDNIQGLVPSNAVLINGKQIGTVFSTSFSNNMQKISVALNLNRPIQIPTNSYATITTSLLGITNLEIRLGKESTFLNPGDTIQSQMSGGLMDEALQRMDPVLYEVKTTMHNLDSVLLNVNGMLDPNTKNNLQTVIANLNKTTSSLAVTSASLQTMLNTQTGALATSLNNVSSFTGNLAKNNEKLSSILNNVDQTTSHLSNLDLEKTLTSLNGTIDDLKNTISKLNSKEGSMGLMLNDKSLYSNLNATSNKLNLLIDDLRLHPKRYVNVSVFGKKDKTKPLTVPLPDTVNAPYLRN